MKVKAFGSKVKTEVKALSFKAKTVLASKIKALASVLTWQDLHLGQSQGQKYYP